PAPAPRSIGGQRPTFRSSPRVRAPNIYGAVARRPTSATCCRTSMTSIWGWRGTARKPRGSPTERRRPPRGGRESAGAGAGVGTADLDWRAWSDAEPGPAWGAGLRARTPTAPRPQRVSLLRGDLSCWAGGTPAGRPGQPRRRPDDSRRPDGPGRHPAGRHG